MTVINEMTNADWEEFERRNTLIEQRLQLNAELEESEGGDIEEASA